MDTLKLTISYIRTLKDLVESDEERRKGDPASALANRAAAAARRRPAPPPKVLVLPKGPSLLCHCGS